jgi:hypothetical protein
MSDTFQKMLIAYGKQHKGKMPSMAKVSKMLDEAKTIDKELRKTKKVPTKLKYADWVKKYFDKDPDHNYWTSEYERCEVGFAPSDLSRYSKKDLKEEYEKYKKNENDFLVYDESTNELIED